MKRISTVHDNNQRGRWMIVDDNAEVLMLVGDILARFDDVEAAFFTSPEDAIAAFTMQPGAFEFVITNLELPGTDDDELARRLRPLTAPLQILLSTGSEILSHQEAVEKGFCEPPRTSFPFAELQHALAPATLKYLETYAGMSQGLTLVHAN